MLRTALTTILAITSALVTFSIASVAAADNSPSLTGFIDSPTTGAVLTAGQPFTINGWMVDPASGSAVGIDAIGVSVSALQSNQAPIDLGRAQLAIARPDVAAATSNPNWSAAGYKLDAPGLPAGTYTLAIKAHTTRGWVDQTATLKVGELDATRWTAHGFNIQAPAPSGRASSCCTTAASTGRCRRLHAEHPDHVGDAACWDLWPVQHDVQHGQAVAGCSRPASRRAPPSWRTS
jgi:hypothetical protein